MRPGPGGALDALPMPLGEPTGLWSAAAALRAAAASVSVAPLASSGGAISSLDAWTGDAANAAGSELAVVAQREQAMADRLTRAAAVLGTYADELDAAQRTVATLQGNWDAALPADPLGPMPEKSLAGIAGTYGVAAADLQLAAEVAARRLRTLVAEVVAADFPGRRGSAVLGSADPRPSDAAVRSAILDGLTVVSAVVAEREASGLADQVVGDLEAVVAGDVGAVDRALARLGARGWDPIVAQALWERLDPEETGRLLDAMAGSGSGASAALLVALGTAFATAANPRSATGLDASTRSRLDAWREPWLARGASSVGSASPRPGGGRIGGAWVQGMLLTGAWQAGLSPGARYAATVGVAVVAADRAARSGGWPYGSSGVAGAGGSAAAALSDTSALGQRLTIPISRDTSGTGRLVAWDGTADPVLAVARALEHDADAGRAWLLASLSGPDRLLVVDHLVAGRYRWMDLGAAAASMGAVARLVAVVGSDPTSRQAVSVDAAFLGAVASEARTTPEPDAYRVALAPALGDVGTVLARHPDALTAVLDVSAGPGVDSALTPDVDRLTRTAR
ncbi:MAG: hypothetical protein ABJA74_14560, partial [Lapillicoccus sp.]